MDALSDSACRPEAAVTGGGPGASVPAPTDAVLGAVIRRLAAPVFLVAGSRHEIRDCNDALAGLFGYRREEILGAPASILSAGFEGGARRQGGARDGILQAGSSHHVLAGREKSGRVFLCAVDCIGLRGEERDYAAAFCLVRDLSHERAREVALRRTANSLTSLACELERLVAPLSSGLSPRLEDFGFSPRQLEVLGLVSRGLSSKEIGAALGIAESTAKNHVACLFERVGVSSRLELVRKLHELGF